MYAVGLGVRLVGPTGNSFTSVGRTYRPIGSSSGKMNLAAARFRIQTFSDLSCFANSRPATMGVFIVWK